MRLNFKPNAEYGVAALTSAFIAVFALLPLSQLVLGVATELLGNNRPQLLANLQSSSTLTATWHSIEVSVMGALLATVYGTLMASVLTLTNLRWRNLLVYAFVMQAILPPQVVALAWLQIWAPLKHYLVASGWESWAAYSNPLQSREGIIVLLGLHYAPLVFLSVRAGLLNVPADVIEAARVAGAMPRTVLLRIIWPLITPALAAGTALAFVSCVGNFGIPAFLGIPADYLVLPTLIYRELSGFGPSAISTATMLSMLAGGLAALGIVLQHTVAKRGHYKVLAHRMSKPPFVLGRGKAMLEFTLLFWVLALLVAPLLALAARSITPAPGVPLSWETATAEHYAYVLFDNGSTLRAFVNSTAMAVAAAGVLSVAAFFLAYLIEYRRHPLLKRLDYLIDLPYAIPGVVLSIALILLYLKPVFGISIYNTLIIIFIAYQARFLTIQLRPIIGGFQQLPKEMLEAAEVFGAPFFRRMKEVVLPLLLPSITAGAVLVIMLAMNELTVSALLWSTGAETLGVVVFSLEQGGESAAAAAMAVLAVLLINILMCIASLAGRKLPSGVLPWRA